MDIIFVLIVLALFATAIAMVIGLTAMSGGGSLDRQFSTTFMWIRVGLQALAILLLALALLFR